MKVLLLLVSLTACAVFAQTGNGSVQGTIRDTSAAVVPGAKIRLDQLATNRQYAGTSTAEGLYFFPSLPPGQYLITVEFSGLQTFKGNLSLQAGQSASIDVPKVSK